MSDITFTFSEPMQVPPDGSGVTISDNGGNTFSIVSVAAGSTSSKLVYSGTWAPSDPVPGIDTVSINYSSVTGDLASVVGYDVGSFSGYASPCGLATNLVATPTGDDSIDLSWTESLDDPTVTYELFRDSVSIQTFTYGDDSYSDTGLSPGTLYAYRLDTLFGVNPIGSITDSATTTIGVPVSASLSVSASFIHSFDLQQTINAPLNAALPQFNTARF